MNQYKIQFLERAIQYICSQVIPKNASSRPTIVPNVLNVPQAYALRRFRVQCFTGPIPANRDFGHFHIEMPEDSAPSSDEHHGTF